MDHQKVEHNFFLFLLVLSFLLTFLIFIPFIPPLIVAIVFATVFSPLYKKTLIFTRERKSLAAMLTTFFILLIVVIPIILIGVQLFKQASDLAGMLTEKENQQDIFSTITNIIINIKNYLRLPINVSIDLNQYIREGLNWVVEQLGPIFSNFTKILLSIFVFSVALYYLFKDGQKLKAAVIKLSPLPDSHNEAIFNKLELAINSVVIGNLVVVSVQGFLTAIGFTIFGIPHAIIWGCIAAIAALIPAIGTSLVLIPGILFLFFQKDYFSAGGLLVWGMTAVGLVDNFLGPKMIERGMRLHPFLILLSILGGIALYWPVGFLLGPLILSFLFSLIDIYENVYKNQMPEKNTNAADEN